MKLSEQTLALMDELTQAIGIPGQERAVSRILKRHYESLGLEIMYDKLGSIYAVKKSRAQNPFRVMVAAHSDEVGLVLTSIKENGLLSFHVIGGIWEQTLPGSRVTLVNSREEQFKGCVCIVSPKAMSAEARSKAVNVNDLLVDIGFGSAAEVRAHGIMEGDMMVCDGPLETLAGGQRLLSKAWDDRYGCILGVELLQLLKNVELPYDLYVGANAQEEAGLRGAATAAQMIRPDLALVLDCTSANDLQKFEMPHGGIGHGVMVRFIDRTYIANRAMLQDFIRVMDEHALPWQHHQSLGGTDAGPINQSFCGVPVLTACICARNVHTPSLMIDADDYIHARQAVLEFLKQLDSRRLETYQNNNR